MKHGWDYYDDWYDEDYDDYDDFEPEEEQPVEVTDADIFAVLARLRDINEEISELNRQTSVVLDALKPSAILVSIIVAIGVFVGDAFLAVAVAPYLGVGTTSVLLVYPAFILYTPLAGMLTYRYFLRHTPMQRYEQLKGEKRELEMLLKRYYGYVPEFKTDARPSYLG